MRQTRLLDLTLTLASLLLFGACQGPDASPFATGADGGVQPQPDMAAPPVDPYSWGEATAGTAIGPLGDFKLFRSGCGEQVWGRWIPKADFTLLEHIVIGPNGQGLDTKLFTTVEFTDKQKTVYMLEQEGQGRVWDAGTYKLNFRVRETGGTTQAYDLQVSSDGLYRWPGQLSFVSARKAGTTQYVTLSSQINGNIQRVITYDDRDCWVATDAILNTGEVIKKGQSSEVALGTSLQDGRRYTFVLQGLDTDRNYVFYATAQTP
jgi:hypothetical protein